MQRQQPQRGPGSFNPVNTNLTQQSNSSRPSLRRIDTSDSDDTATTPLAVSKSRQPSSAAPGTPIYAQFTSHTNASNASLHQNYSRPQGNRSVTQGGASPLLKGAHSRKHSNSQGLFDSTLPSTSSSNLSHVGMSHAAAQAASNAALSASQIAAQAAVMSHQNAHSRQRSQTVPFPGDNDGTRRGSGGKGPVSPPMLSLTEASAPRDNGFANHGNHHNDRLGGSHSSAATAAANVVFPRSGYNSPRGPQSVSPQPYSQPPPPPPASEKPLKSEKSKVKLFSRPGKISTKGDPKDKPLPSPGKSLGSALSALQRGNFSTTSLVEPNSQSMYSLNNSSSATIRPIDTPTEEKGKEKEKKHHFLSRQKHKLKDEYHLPLSSAASNSRPTDPNAPNPLYNFNIPPSPGPNSTSFVKTKKDKKLGERSDSRLESESSFNLQSEWPGPSSLPSLSQQSTMYDPVDPGKLGLHNHMSLDDAWPYLKAKLLVIFEGEDLRLPVEDFNRVVQMHIQWCMHRRSPNAMLEDLRDLLITGFSSLDRTLRKTPEDHFIPTLVELWLFTFTSILPYMQAVFLPLDLEVSGCGTIMTTEQSRDFWGGVLTSSSGDKTARVTPAATALDVRRLVLIAYRDIVILPRYDTLKTIFSRLSLEFLPSSLANTALASPTPDALNLSTSPSESFGRPGTAMSLDPSNASYNSNSTTLLGDGSAGTRSRAISNVSFGSHASDGVLRPFTPSALGSVREQNVEDSKQVTDMVGRMLQCMSVLASLGGVAEADDDGGRKVVELCKMLKLNWLGRGRTGRNRRGIVGGRVRREDVREEVRVA
ncbi:Fc.00g030960.m01.CDS01 [Cosmosporella sp. VM-42]